MNNLYNVYIYDEDGNEQTVLNHLSASEAMNRMLDNEDHGMQCIIEKAGIEMEEEK